MASARYAVGQFLDDQEIGRVRLAPASVLLGERHAGESQLRQLDVKRFRVLGAGLVVDRERLGFCGGELSYHLYECSLLVVEQSDVLRHGPQDSR